MGFPSLAYTKVSYSQEKSMSDSTYDISDGLADVSVKFHSKALRNFHISGAPCHK